MVNISFRHYNHEKQRIYARRVPEQKWQSIKPAIGRMFQQGLTHAAILSELREYHGFHISKGQLVDRLKRWSMNTYKPRLVQAGFNNALAQSDDNGALKFRTLHIDNFLHYIVLQVEFPPELPLCSDRVWRMQQETIARILCLDNRGGLREEDTTRTRKPSLRPLVDAFLNANNQRPQLADIPIKVLGVTGRAIQLKRNRTTIQLRMFQGEALNSLRKSLAQMTLLDKCDLGLFHIVLCLALESILHLDTKRFITHREMASNMLQGILQHWGIGSQQVFEGAIECVRSLQEVDDLRLVSRDCLSSLFLPDKRSDLPGYVPHVEHGCLQYGCSVTR